MEICINICMSKIVCVPIKVGGHMYAMYTNCWTLTHQLFWATKGRWVKFPKYVCLVVLLGKHFLEKQILKIILDIVW